MTGHRVLAPPRDQWKTKGPQSYFESIERHYGRPIQEWLDIAADRLDESPHMQVVEELKSEFGMGHGHANAIVAYAKAGLSG